MRNLGLTIALWLTALLPLNSHALGLGEIEVHSFLNQPLKAEIEVLSVRPGEVDDLLVGLASREAFTRAGLARPQHLSDLKFTVEKNEEGDEAVIIVSSRGAIKEPFLNFLVEADWSKGRLLREFTILLDPPFFAEQPPAPEPVATTSESQQAPAPEPAAQSGGDMVAEPSTTGGSVTEPIATSGGSSQAADTSMSQDSGNVTATSPPQSSDYLEDESQNIIEGDVLIVKGDTLWSIASRYKGDDHSMSQVMLAFQRANPDAFGDGNINNLKVGSVLRVPSRAEMYAMDEQSAYAEVLLQNGLWDEYVARVGGDSFVSDGFGSSESGGEAGEQSDGELSLLMPGSDDSEATGTGDSAEIEQLRTKLALAEEELEATRIENEDLESRVSELQARLSKIEELQKMVEIEDDSLAQLQADQASQDTMDPVDTTLGDDVVDESAQTDEQALIEELLAEEAAAQAEEEAAAQAEEAASGTDGDAVAEPADEAAQQQDDMMAEDSDSAVTEDGMLDGELVDESAQPQPVEGDQMMDEETQTATVTPPPAPVIVTEPAARSSSIFDGILPPSVIDMIAPIGALFGDPIVLAAIGGVIVLLLVLVVVKRRRAAKGDDDASGDDDLFASDDEEDFTPIHMDDAEASLDTDISMPAGEVADVGETEIGGDVAPAEEDDMFGATAVVDTAAIAEAEPAAPAAAAEQDDVLNEVDVYLAYGLYDNAEELLASNLAENPQRADYRSKLLDTYFATKKTDAFVAEAEKLKEMGDAGASYWDRVQIMGYELAPDNALFSDAKDSELSAADLEIAKPQEADFDLGSDDEDDTQFSADDFNLGDEDIGTDISLDASGEAGDLGATQQVSEEEMASLGEGDAGDDELLDLPDDLGAELEFSMDDQGAGDELDMADSETTGEELQLPDDLELSDDLDFDDVEPSVEAKEETQLDFAEESPDEEPAPAVSDDDDLDFDIDAGLDVDDDDLNLDDAVELSPPDEDDPAFAPTSIITPNYEETAVIDSAAADEIVESEDPSEIDLGMDDTAIVDSVEAIESIDDSEIDLGMDDTAMSTPENIADATGELSLDTDDADDEEDISIIDFGGDDFEEPTDIVESVDDIGADDFEIDDDSAELNTGTFAPGDFEEPTQAVASIADVDDIDDLMLPDDVDEVSTKLDLARAFIDMGDTEGARGSLEEVMSEGNADQKAEAKALLDQI